MSLRKVLLGLPLCLLTLVGTAHAATFSASGSASGLTDWSVQFTDANLNGKMDFIEITPSTFTGFTLFGTTLDRIGSIPNTVFSVCGGGNALSCPVGGWRFTASTGLISGVGLLADEWSSYRVTGLSPVPVPAALPLLASGLGALGFIGWRRKRKSNVTV